MKYKDRFNNGNITSIICTYTDRFYPYLSWLKLNGIKYDLRETDMYENGLEIVIYRGETKQKRKLIDYYLNVGFVRIRKKPCVGCHISG